MNDFLFVEIILTVKYRALKLSFALNKGKYMSFQKI